MINIRREEQNKEQKFFGASNNFLGHPKTSKFQNLFYSVFQKIQKYQFHLLCPNKNELLVLQDINIFLISLAF